MRNNKNKKRLLIAAASIAGAAVIGTVVALTRKPDVVTNPCWRTFHKADGTPKKPFDTALQANLQSLKQLVQHGEVCNPYQANGKFFTGHSNTALVRSINPIKLLQKGA